MADRHERPTATVARLPLRVAARADAARLLPSGRSLLLGLALFVLAAAAFIGARQSALFAITVIDVRGADDRVAAEVRAALRAELGVSLLKLEPATVDRELAGVPDVRAASLDRAFPHTLVVTVRQELPVAVLRRGAESWIISARGRVLRRISLGGSRTLPRIWVAKSADVRAGGTLDAEDGGRAAAALAPLAGTSLFSRVLYVRTTDDEVTLVLRSGVELRLGDVGDLRLKLAIARRILGLLGSSAGAGSYLDVSVPERPVARTNPQVEG